ncbi:MAG: glycosyltransferase [Lachnospiraceae bacterium]|nr:glycosyltransferase [Lachnospiraceae bacterium]
MVKALKIAVLDIAASKTGALSILRDFYGYVKDRDSCENEWIFITGVPGILEDVPEKKIRVICRDDVKASSKNRLMFDLFTGKDFLKSLSPDVVFSLQNTLPSGLKCKKKILYVHQPLGYQKVKRFSLLKKDERHLAMYQYLYAPLVDSSVKKADITIVQTAWMREAVIKKTGISEDRIREIPPDIPDITGFAKGITFDPKSFFYPAGDILYKNHALIEEAAKLLESEGINDIKLTFTKDHPLSREEVCRKYFESTLVFPSYIETYGLPLAEGMQTGNPILAADTPFAGQILEGYERAYFFDPFDPRQLKELMRDVYEGRITPDRPAAKKETANTYEEIVKIIEE